MKIIVSQKLSEAISNLPVEALESLTEVADMTHTDVYGEDGTIPVDAMVHEVAHELNGDFAVAGVGRGTCGATIYFFIGEEQRALDFVDMARRHLDSYNHTEPVSLDLHFIERDGGRGRWKIFSASCRGRWWRTVRIFFTQSLWTAFGTKKAASTSTTSITMGTSSSKTWLAR
jgi:hypothetical protein